MSSPQPPNQTFPFLSLPLELRHQIYSYLLPEQVKISQPRPFYERSCHPWALTYVCRTTRHEVLSALYSQAHIMIDLRKHRRGNTMQAYNDWIADLHPAFARLISRLEIQTVVEYEREVTLQPHEQWVEHGGFMMINKKYADLKFILNRVNGEFVVSIEEVRSCVTHFVFRPRKSFKRAVGRLSGPRWRGTQTRGVAVDMNMVLALSLEEINKPSEEKKNARLGKGSIESVVESLMLHRTLDVTKPRVAANGVWFIEEDTETGMRCRTLLRTEHNEPRRCKTVTDAVIYGDDMVERDEVFALGMGESTLERRRSW